MMPTETLQSHAASRPLMLSVEYRSWHSGSPTTSCRRGALSLFMLAKRAFGPKGSLSEGAGLTRGRNMAAGMPPGSGIWNRQGGQEVLETAPAVIERFMEAAGRRDYVIIAECFFEDATVEEEARTHRGRRQIEE